MQYTEHYFSHQHPHNRHFQSYLTTNVAISTIICKSAIRNHTKNVVGHAVVAVSELCVILLNPGNSKDATSSTSAPKLVLLCNFHKKNGWNKPNSGKIFAQIITTSDKLSKVCPVDPVLNNEKRCYSQASFSFKKNCWLICIEPQCHMQGSIHIRQ